MIDLINPLYFYKKHHENIIYIYHELIKTPGFH